MCIDFRVKKMMVVEIVLVISDEIRASPSGKGSIRKNQTVLTFLKLPDLLLHHARKCIRLLLKKLCSPLYSLYIRL